MCKEGKAGHPRGDDRPDVPLTRRPGLAPRARARIGVHLRAFYESVVEEPVPDRFRDLIERLGETPHPAKTPDPDAAPAGTDPDRMGSPA